MTIIKTLKCEISYGEVRIQMNGKKMLSKWIEKIGFSNSKHSRKIKRIAGGGFEPPTSTRSM